MTQADEIAAEEKTDRREIELKQERRGNLKIKALTVVVVVSLVLLALLTYGKFKDSPTINDVKKVVERSDCAREIGNEQQILKDDLTSASRNLSVLNAKGLVAVATDNDEALLALVPEYNIAITHLEDTKQIVDDIPPTQEVVNKRCTNL